MKCLPCCCSSIRQIDYDSCRPNSAAAHGTVAEDYRGGGYINLLIYIALSFIVSATIIPLIIFLCHKQGWYDHINERKVHSGSVPRLGGVGFAAAFAIATCLYLSTQSNLSLELFFPIIIAGLIIFAFGIIDDFLELPAKLKFLVQVVATFIMIFSGTRFTQLGPWHLGVLSYPVTFFWVIGVINAFNLIDGVDALCGSISTLVLLTLGSLYLIAHRLDIAGICLILAVAVAGFLLYNKPKAKIFMGDGGSQFLGFMIASIPLFPFGNSFDYNRTLVAFILASIPILDTIAAIWRRTREGRSFFSPDRAHLHHKLMNMGYSTRGLLAILVLLQFGLCAFVFIGLWCGPVRGSFILLGAVCVASAFFVVIHYTHRAVVREHNIVINEKIEGAPESQGARVPADDEKGIS